MKFSNNFNFKNAFSYGVKRVSRGITAPFQMLYRKIVYFLSPNSIVGKVSGDVRKGIKDIGKKPDSQKHYFLIGNHYVAKKLMLVLAVLLILLPLVWIRFIFPAVQSAFLTKTMVINSAETTGYNGKVILIDNKKDKNVIFKGKMEEGRLNGYGVLYNYSGQLVYKGEFVMERYEGTGDLFYPGGQLRYSGTFRANKFSGEGVLHEENGGILYEGGFANGFYEGFGMLYKDGKILYTGNFSQNNYHGNGKLYYESGAICYQGDFANGLYSGRGKLYSDGGSSTVIYEGDFKDGLYDGTGYLYEKNGARYVGSFAFGQKNGMGKQYQNNMLIAEGLFEDGIYKSGSIVMLNDKGEEVYRGSVTDNTFEGIGTFYSYENGVAVKYTGEFKDGKYDGNGSLYADGELVYEGMFAKGKFEGQGKRYAYTGGEQVLIYDGEHEGGNMSGAGKVFDAGTGALVYEGFLYNGKYEGEGKQYNPVTKLIIFEGSFMDGKYHGTGKLYNEKGALVYDGGFTLGAKSGMGTTYDPLTGNVIFEGSFADGEPSAPLDGNVTLFDKDGNIIYEGGLAGGKRDGKGTEYGYVTEYIYETENGYETETAILRQYLIYQGEFENDIYQGKGMLFDMETQNAVYDGMFESGVKTGEGKRFDAENGRLIYEGSFYNDKYEGEGKQYDAATGRLIYDGSFINGMFNGKGKLYFDNSAVFADKDGIVLESARGMSLYFEGFFQNGKPEGYGRLCDKGTDNEVAVVEITDMTKEPYYQIKRSSELKTPIDGSDEKDFGQNGTS